MDTQAEFLGPLLVEENLLVPEQLDLALKFAESTGLPLDQIVVAEFAVPQPDISRLLAQLNGEASETEEAEVEPPVIVPPARPLGFRIRRPIGQIFVDLGFITTDDREAALEVQRESGALLGEILVEQGKLTRLELANALSEHWASFTTDSVSTPDDKPSLSVVPPANGSPPSPAAPEIAELRRSLDELEAARAADARAAATRINAIDDALATLVPSNDEEFRQAMTERLHELTSKVEATGSGSTGVDLVARLDELAGVTSELRSELEALASRTAEAGPSEGVSELKQMLDALTQTLDDRLTTLATELRAENATRTDEIGAQLRAQTEELAVSIATSRVDALNETWRADADAANLANDKLREKLDELMAVRATDVEATQAAHAQASHAAAEAARIEHALRSELEALASLQAEAEQGESVVELKQAIDAVSTQLGEQTERFESTRAADAEAAESANGHLRERLDELIALRATDIEATQAAQAQATHAAAETARIEHALRSELETLADASHADPDELKQTIDALAQTTDERLATLATELRAETATRTDDVAAQLRAQTDDLAALRETVAESRRADAEVAELATNELRQRLDELIALRTTDLETNEAAQARTASETARIEHALRSELETLASLQVDHEPDERVSELAQAVDALTRNTDDRLDAIATELRAHAEKAESSRAADADAAKSANGHLRERLEELVTLRTTDIEANRDAQAHAAAETARIEHALRAELEALAASQAAADPDALKQTINALAQSIDTRLETTATDLRAETAIRTDDISAQLRDHIEKIESSRAADGEVVKSASGQIHRRLDELGALQATHIEAAQAAQAQATHAAAETARIEHALRSELETLASLQAEADPDELKQTVSGLAQLQAETAGELTATIAALRESVAAIHAESKQNADAWADACRTLTSRVDDLDQTRRADTDAAEHASNQLNHRLDELMALRAADLETTQAAHLRAAAETARIEHGLVGALGDLTVQLDDIKNQLGGPVPDSRPIRVDDEPIADDSGARDPKPGKKRSKQGKGKKKNPKH